MQPGLPAMDDTKLSVIDHLEEMRVRILKCLVCLCVLFPLGYACSQPAIEWVKRTFCPEVKQLIYLQPLELFFTRIKVGFIMAIIAGFPYIAFHLWKFISPGLYKRERHYISRFVFVSSFLFLTGASFALFFIFPTVLRFAMGMASSDIAPMLHVKSVINLAAMLMLGFGVMFQLPILVYTLAVTELVSLETMRRSRPVVVVVIFVASAILTPPDVVSQLAMGIPSLFLFEVSLLVSAMALRRKHQREAAEKQAEEAEAAVQAAHQAEADGHQVEPETIPLQESPSTHVEPPGTPATQAFSEPPPESVPEGDFYPDNDDFYNYEEETASRNDAGTETVHPTPTAKSKRSIRRKPVIGAKVTQRRRNLLSPPPPRKH